MKGALLVNLRQVFDFTPLFTDIRRDGARGSRRAEAFFGVGVAATFCIGEAVAGSGKWSCRLALHFRD